MADKRVKVVGYAQKVKTQSGVEYRNFSDRLVGNQFTSDGGSTLFTLGNFRVTTNLDPKSDKLYRTSKFGKFYNLGELGGSDELSQLVEPKQLVLNMDFTDVTNYAYFGSLKEYVRISLENIITTWPASLYVRDTNLLVPSSPYQTYEPVTPGVTIYNELKDISTFKINKDAIKNDFSINIKKGGTIINTFNEKNQLRDFTASYSQYVIHVGGEDYPVLGFTGYDEEGYITLTVKGKPFTSGVYPNYHIKPSKTQINKFYLELNEFEGHLLNRNTDFKADFRFDYESENGHTIIGKKTVKWPKSDGYNIDFQSEYYVDYVNQLLEIAKINDENKSNILSNRMVSESIFEFDTIDQKMTKTLKIYGRSFDEVKKYSTGIKFSNVVTYDKKNNTPDNLIKNLARTMGWELTSSLFNVDFNEDFLTTKGELNLSPVQSEIELWRRLIINSPWIWKSKGTRKAVEFLLKFVGTPEGLVTFNEHIYKASNKIDIEELKVVLEENDIPFDENALVVDKDGYPRVLPNNGDMYFQKGGLWYRQTSGDNANIEVLSGNNPHVGPYDSGYEYINQFNSVISNFKPVTLTNTKSYGTVENTFLNYDHGKFDKFFSNDVIAEVDLNVDFQGIYDTNLNECLGSNFDFNDCDVETTWYLETYVDGVLLSQNQMFHDINLGAVPTRTNYLTVLGSVKNALGTDEEVSGDTYRFIEKLVDCEGGSQLLNKKIEFKFKLDFEYGCYEAPICGDLIVTGKTTESLVLFENATNNLVPSKECCRDLGYTSKLVPGGFECYNQVEPLSPNTDIYVFMDTTSLTSGDGLIAKTAMNTFYDQYKLEYPDYVGNLYILPTTDEKWVNYPNMVWDGIIPTTALNGWSDIAVLPANLNTGSWIPPTELLVVALVDESNSTYHTAQLSDGYMGQPTTHFISNYNSLLGHIKNRDFTHFKGILYPIIKDPQGEGGAFIQHALAAIMGTVLTPDEIQKINSPVNLSLLTQSNPYENYLINGATQERLQPLRNLNWSAIYNKIAPADDVYNSERFIKDLYYLMINNEDDNIYTVDSTSIDASEDDIII